ncbi:5-oxoprolinase subunit C family protein [Acuticoccus mangrovi]|uniref:Biotin-dependent carboxyltransferase family protein n=1 Tax=Acuticoccus mangrovi TaxID=2796142 RepID=A0A934MLS0_9HYPH|nr:biotin-dependent carboxyltransferase family protein [Acuticoccus mangrovi]
MTTIEVVEPGLQTTVQDRGRFGYQALGVPVSGVLDFEAMRLANALVGNGGDAAVLEMRMVGPSLKAAEGTVRMALAGSEAKLTITLADGATRTVPAHQAFDLPADAVVKIGPLKGSVTACLAVSGGVDVPPLFGSRATYLRGPFGGHEGRALRAGDRLAIGEGAPAGPPLAVEPIPAPAGDTVLRVVLGPQADWFTDKGIATFLEEPYVIDGATDRMGMRLNGPEIEHVGGYNLVSDGIATGAIQVPGSRLPILLLADHQTTGGYPKIANVISADLPLAGRLGPGGVVRFEAVSVADAEVIRRDAEAALARRIGAMAPAQTAAEPSLAALSGENLISGVVDATNVGHPS